MVYIKSYPDQTLLLPTNLRDIIPKDHICFLIEEVVKHIDFMEFDKNVEGPGNPTYHPRINLKILIYGICEKVTSSRKLEKLTIENIIFRYLSENLNPNFHTIAMFRKDNHELIKKCFLQTIEIAKKLELVNLNKIYLDGIRIKANASKSKNFTKEEIEFLSRLVDEQLIEADKEDEMENKIYGESDGEIKIPEHLTHKRKLQEKVKEMLEDVGRAKKQMDKAKERIDKHNLKEVNLTDIDSKTMKMKRGLHYQQAYNCQLVVEDKGEFIVGNLISDSLTDTWETIPAMEKFKEEQDKDLKDVEVFQDNGYCCSQTAEYYDKEEAIAYIPDRDTAKKFHGKKIDKFDSINFQLDFDKNQAICPAGHKMDFVRKRVNKKTGGWTNVYKTDKCFECPFKNECVCVSQKQKFVEINPFIRKIGLRLSTEEGKKKYGQRFHKGEVAQAHIEGNLGYREFRSRGIKSCENEMNLFSTAYNIRKLYNTWINNNRKLVLKLVKIMIMRNLTNLCYES